MSDFELQEQVDPSFRDRDQTGYFERKEKELDVETKFFQKQCLGVLAKTFSDTPTDLYTAFLDWCMGNATPQEIADERGLKTAQVRYMLSDMKNKAKKALERYGIQSSFG